MLNQAKLRSYSTATKFKNGYQVPRNYAKAVRIDERNSGSKWQEAIDLDLQQIYRYDTFAEAIIHPQRYQKNIRRFGYTFSLMLSIMGGAKHS
jgi:hypothetical protein